MRDPVVGADHHPSHRGEGGADDERQGDDAIDVNAHQPRDLRIFGGSPHRHTEAGAVHHEREPDHHHHGYQHDPDLYHADVGAGELEYGVLHDLGKRQRTAAQMRSATCCRMIDRPIAVISGASRGAPRSGR